MGKGAPENEGERETDVSVDLGSAALMLASAFCAGAVLYITSTLAIIQPGSSSRAIIRKSSREKERGSSRF